MTPHEKGRAAVAVPALPKSFGGDTDQDNRPVQLRICPLICGGRDGCPWRCPDPEAVTP